MHQHLINYQKPKYFILSTIISNFSLYSRNIESTCRLLLLKIMHLSVLLNNSFKPPEVGANKTMSSAYAIMLMFDKPNRQMFNTNK